MTSVPPSTRPLTLAAKPAHFPAKAKNVIWLFMNGGPSQVDTWDYKPELAKREWSSLSDENKLVFSPAIIATEGSPQFEVRTPKQRGRKAQ